MAMTKCKECGAEISTKAESCPKCGAKRSGGGNIGCGTVIVGIFVAILLISLFSGNKTPTKPPLSDAECRKELRCWAERHRAAAARACAPQIERQGAYGHRWTVRSNVGKFSRYAWADEGNATVRYFGDAIEYQNAFGAWLPHTYSCTYGTITGRVLAVDAIQGRI
jgi:hypothetical protein